MKRFLTKPWLTPNNRNYNTQKNGSKKLQNSYVQT
jgi:hypothetical protein